MDCLSAGILPRWPTDKNGTKNLRVLIKEQLVETMGNEVWDV